MKQNIIHIGLDVDDTQYHGATFNKATGEVVDFKCRPTLKGLLQQLDRMERHFKGHEIKLCYEASYVGYCLQRDLISNGVHCDIVSPRSIPSPRGKAIKTDRIDAGYLAQFYANNLLTIAAARFAVQGTSSYPDATFTLRITYGSVTGWEENGEYVEPFSHTKRLFERATGEDPFRVPPKWMAVRDKLDPDTPFNFVSSLDLTGGNSGSPVIDQNAQLVGLAFDGNIPSIVGSYFYDETRNRAVAVHPAIMLEALTKVYEAKHLVEELDPE